jgi:hypothetical protein
MSKAARRFSIEETVRWVIREGNRFLNLIFVAMVKAIRIKLGNSVVSVRSKEDGRVLSAPQYHDLPI